MKINLSPFCVPLYTIYGDPTNTAWVLGQITGNILTPSADYIKDASTGALYMGTVTSNNQGSPAQYTLDAESDVVGGIMEAVSFGSKIRVRNWYGGLVKNLEGVSNDYFHMTSGNTPQGTLIMSSGLKHENFALPGSGEVYIGRRDTYLKTTGAGAMYLNGKLLMEAGLGVGNSVVGDVTGTTANRKIEVFDTSGASLGFLQIYAGP